MASLVVRQLRIRLPMQPTPVSLPRKSHGQRSLAGYTMSQRVRHNTEKQQEGGTECSSLTITQLGSGRAGADSLRFPWPQALSLSPSSSMELGVGGQGERGHIS